MRERFVRARLKADERVSHDSHHRGQIALALKQSGLKLPEETAINDIWYSWYGGDPS